MPEATSASDLDARISSTGWSLVDFGDCIRIYTNTRFPDVELRIDEAPGSYGLSECVEQKLWRVHDARSSSTQGAKPCAQGYGNCGGV